MHYNWHRYYDPASGRYITSDPIGLDSGINTYGYALQNPLKYIDSYGLNARCDALKALYETPNTFFDGSDLYWEEITQETYLLPKLDIPIVVEGVDLQYTLIQFNFTQTVGLLPALASTAFFGLYSRLGSAHSTHGNGVGFYGWLAETSTDLEGVMLANKHCCSRRLKTIRRKNGKDKCKQ